MGATGESLHVMVCFSQTRFILNEMFNKDASRIMKNKLGGQNKYIFLQCDQK